MADCVNTEAKLIAYYMAGVIRAKDGRGRTRNHKWKWESGEAIPGRITVYCEGGCDTGSKMNMHRIGPRHFAAIARKAAA